MIVSGYACTDAVCRYGGRLAGQFKVLPGAFAPLPATVPLLLEHGTQIGTVEQLVLKHGSLWITAETEAKTDGMFFSVGFRPKKGVELNGYTLVYEGSLKEVSVVKVPVNSACRIEQTIPSPASNDFYDHVIEKFKKLEELARCLSSIS